MEGPNGRHRGSKAFDGEEGEALAFLTAKAEFPKFKSKAECSQPIRKCSQKASFPLRS